MAGTNRSDGSELDGWQHCMQSVIDILTTPIGTRVMRREYGSNVPTLIDRPGENDIVLEVTMATGDAIAKWEPRFVFRGLGITGPLLDDGSPDVPHIQGGVFQIDIVGDYYPRAHLGDYSVYETDREIRVPVGRASFIPLPVGS